MSGSHAFARNPARELWRDSWRDAMGTKRGATSGAGLYRPADEHDACGVGFVAHIKGQRSHAIVRHALDLLINLEHRGACGSDPDTGDGAGILVQMPDRVPAAVAAASAAGRRIVRRRPGVPARSTRRRAPRCAR